ncbi:MAG: hypothetical protein LUD02_02765 [Tannerellaceae bacterium]|nr:hypothetical protein [Tannerellaceae bacterium]MCD8263195.1 hypothetical protein [Tannerellaceae bacterium]
MINVAGVVLIVIIVGIIGVCFLETQLAGCALFHGKDTSMLNPHLFQEVKYILLTRNLLILLLVGMALFFFYKILHAYFVIEQLQVEETNRETAFVRKKEWETHLSQLRNEQHINKRQEKQEEALKELQETVARLSAAPLSEIDKQARLMYLYMLTMNKEPTLTPDELKQKLKDSKETYGMIRKLLEETQTLKDE